MKILNVVHSFIPFTMAETEIYSYTLSKTLMKRHEVFVFYRTGNEYQKEYFLTHSIFDGLETYAINHTFRLCNSFVDTYQDDKIDAIFGRLLDKIKPDIVHIHHLLFLSIGIVHEIKKRGIPIVYTLHDYWLLCYRGQLIKGDMSSCNGNSTELCSSCLKYLLRINKYSMRLYKYLRAYMPSFVLRFLKEFCLIVPHAKASHEPENRRKGIEAICSRIDLFIAPSKFIKNKFIEYGLPAQKITFSPNGSDGSNFITFPKSRPNVLRFAYMGTLLPTKGIDILIKAFRELEDSNVELSIYGELRSYIGFESYPGLLKKIVGRDKRIKFKGRYAHHDVGKIFADVDVLVVPSIWPENSPMVIQEAFESKNPVIASNIGGIPELVRDGVNGLLFKSGDVSDLRQKLKYVTDNPELLQKWRKNIPKVKDIEDNARELEEIYCSLLKLAVGTP